VFTQTDLESAYPDAATRAHHPLPLNLYYAWPLNLLNLTDNDFHDAVRRSAAQLTAVALAEGQDITSAGSTLYPNYAIFDTPLEKMYGANVDRLHALKQQVDPNNVMGLAGGWKF
jgi:FAD/FMN-containing dehydrogenase